MVLYNADLGEGVEVGGQNIAHKVAPHIHLANISCGAHAGSKEHIKETIRICIEHNVLIGAHPSYPDKENFGRWSMDISPGDLMPEVESQIKRLQKWAKESGERLHHVKAHGALYNDLMKDRRLFEAFEECVKKIDDSLCVIGQLPEDEPQPENFLCEAFVDRLYTPEGLLTSRQEAGSVFYDKSQIKKQFDGLLNGEVQTQTGQTIPIRLDTLCIHCDNAAFVELLPELSPLNAQALNENSVLLQNMNNQFGFCSFLEEKLQNCQLVESYDTLLIETTDGRAATELLQEVESLSRKWKPKSLRSTSETIEIPVFYSLELESVAKKLNISPEELVAKHSSKPYKGSANGFLPGVA